jgi:hypothetical protein
LAADVNQTFGVGNALFPLELSPYGFEMTPDAVYGQILLPQVGTKVAYQESEFTQPTTEVKELTLFFGPTERLHSYALLCEPS